MSKKRQKKGLESSETPTLPHTTLDRDTIYSLVITADNLPDNKPNNAPTTIEAEVTITGLLKSGIRVFPAADKSSPA